MNKPFAIALTLLAVCLTGCARTQIAAGVSYTSETEMTTEVPTTEIIVPKQTETTEAPTTEAHATETTVTEPITTEAPTTEPPTGPPTEPPVQGLTVSPISVGMLKATWEAEEGTEYTILCESTDENYAYYGNMHYDIRENGLCYINGLRENSDYLITVMPVTEDGESRKAQTLARTETVDVIQEFPYEAGWTSCFAAEKASGLTAMPSSGAIYGSVADPITGTGIRRDEYGDYCCAMGLWYGVCWDRFLVELDNGIQFTVKICDSKGWADDADADLDGDGAMDYYVFEDGSTIPAGDGVGDGRFHWFGHGAGKCVIEFIYDDGNLPSCVRTSGSWGGYNWNGLDLGSNISSIKKINYGEPVVY